MAFANKIQFRNSPEDLAIAAKFEAEFQQKTGWTYPQTDLQWRELFAAAAFTPQEEREIRTKFADESEIAEYYSGPGALITTLMARLPKTTGQGGDSPVELPTVNLTTNQVRYADVCHDVTADGALLFNNLVESYPQAFSASTLFTKPSRVKQGLPDSLKAMIVAEAGKGYRLKLD